MTPDDRTGYQMEHGDLPEAFRPLPNAEPWCIGYNAALKDTLADELLRMVKRYVATGFNVLGTNKDGHHSLRDDALALLAELGVSDD